MTRTALERRAYAIARARERRSRELAPLRAEIDRLVQEVGWHQARPIVEAVMAPCQLSGPRGAWRARIGKRTGAALVAALGALPVQGRLALGPIQSSCSVESRRDDDYGR
jgi:hypothetical protein